MSRPARDGRIEKYFKIIFKILIISEQTRAYERKAVQIWSDSNPMAKPNAGISRAMKKSYPCRTCWKSRKIRIKSFWKPDCVRYFRTWERSRIIRAIWNWLLLIIRWTKSPNTAWRSAKPETPLTPRRWKSKRGYAIKKRKSWKNRNCSWAISRWWRIPGRSWLTARNAWLSPRLCALPACITAKKMIWKPICRFCLARWSRIAARGWNTRRTRTRFSGWELIKIVKSRLPVSSARWAWKPIRKF